MFHRFIEDIVFEALEVMPIILLRGARQSGKTTLVKSIAKKDPDYQYLTFDHLPVLTAAKEDPSGFINRVEKPVILDEIQKVPELFLPIKMDVDEHREPGRYLLTGSADPLLMPKLGDSLAGRMRLLSLWPFSQGEIRGTRENFLERAFKGELLRGAPCGKECLISLIVQGGYPVPFAMKTEQQKQNWFLDYISLVLQKDVLDLSKIENVSEMPRLLTLLAARVGSLLNLEELSRSLKFPSMTLHRYFELLRSLFFIYLLPPWSKNFGKRLVKSPKIYLNDTGLLLFLLNMDQTRLRQDPHLFGSVLENFVVIELIKQISWHPKIIHPYHYRDYSKNEVDIILEGPGGDLLAIEVKSSETVTKSDFKGLKALQEQAGDRLIHGIVLYSGTDAIPFGEKLTACPISSLWEGWVP